MKPRHYILIVLILALGAWNFWRARHHAAAPVTTADSGSPWALYDHAASLRDDHTPQFDQALATLNARLDHPEPSLTPGQLQDLHGCQMWLLYYRHAGAAVAAPGSSKPADWNKLAAEHVDSCVATHRDVAR